MNPLVHVEIYPRKGRALVATTAIKKSSQIDVCPVVVVTARQARDLDHTPLRDYYMRWEGDIDEGGLSAVAFGLVSLCNHSDEPNARVEPDYEENEMRLYAMRDIQPGEEITIRYAQIWFEEAP